jgi:hypothetical protein
MDKAESRSEPDVRRIIQLIEDSLESVVRDVVDDIWQQVAAYRNNPDEGIRGDVTRHVEVIFRLWISSLKEGRRARRSDFPTTAEQAARRVRQGISLSDFLHAYRVAQLGLWDAVLDVARDDPETRDAALAMAEKVMHMVEVGSSVGAEAFLTAQQHEIAEIDRVRRDVLEDLLARRDVSPGPKQAMLRGAGLEPGSRYVVATATTASPPNEDRTASEAVSVVRKLAAGAPGLVVVRQEETVGVVPAMPNSLLTLVDHVEHEVDRLARQGTVLRLGVSTTHTGFPEVPEAYAEACTARDSLGGAAGMVALPRLSSLGYLTLRDDETARRLISPRVRQFVLDDMATDGLLIDTLLAYTSSDLNAKAAAESLHIHVNTAYYRLERISERTGCDLRSFADILELTVAVRLLARPGS